MTEQANDATASTDADAPAAAAPAGDGAATAPFDMAAFLTSGWKEQVPERFRGAGVVVKAGKLEDLINSAVNAEKLIGKDPNRLIEMPDLSDPDKAGENVLAVLRKLGAPETADAVELPKLEGLPGGFEPDKVMQAWFKETGATLGLLPSQMQGLYKSFMSRVMQDVATGQEQERQDTEAKVAHLKQELGAAYEPRLAAFKSAAAQLGEGFVTSINKAGLALDPAFVTTIAKLGPLLSGDKGFDTAGGAAMPGVGVTPTEARMKADDLTREGIKLMNTDRTKSRELLEQAAQWRERANAGGL